MYAVDRGPKGKVPADGAEPNQHPHDRNEPSQLQIGLMITDSSGVSAASYLHRVIHPVPAYASSAMVHTTIRGANVSPNDATS